MVNNNLGGDAAAATDADRDADRHLCDLERAAFDKAKDHYEMVVTFLIGPVLLMALWRINRWDWMAWLAIIAWAGFTVQVATLLLLRWRVTDVHRRRVWFAAINAHIGWLASIVATLFMLKTTLTDHQAVAILIPVTTLIAFTAHRRWISTCEVRSWAGAMLAEFNRIHGKPARRPLFPSVHARFAALAVFSYVMTIGLFASIWVTSGWSWPLADAVIAAAGLAIHVGALVALRLRVAERAERSRLFRLFSSFIDLSTSFSCVVVSTHVLVLQDARWSQQPVFVLVTAAAVAAVVFDGICARREWRANRR